MWSGRLAAELMDQALAESTDARSALERYERRVQRAMRFYWRMVEAYYTPWFMELFLRPNHRFDIPASVNAVLAGDLEPGWRIRWRLALFFLLVRIQKHFPLAPRLDFTSAPATAPKEGAR